MNQARKKAGLDDFGDDSFREGLERLIRSLESEAKLSLVGHIAAKAMILDNLLARLSIIDYRKQRPSVTDRPIVQPLFVAGLPRTGSTILFELLAQDPAHRAPTTWEVAKPMPPATPDTFESDARIAEVDTALDRTELLAPGFKAIHEIGATLPQECVAILASHFMSDQYSTTFNVPSYRQWCRQQDMAAAYDWHHQFLQHLQADFMKDRWVLKTPVHIGYLHALLARYPDARIVQTHRDPMTVIGSAASLTCTLRSAFSDDIDPVAVGPQEAEHFAFLLKQGMAQRDAVPDQSRFYDLQFRDLVTEPLAAIEAMYAHFGMQFTTTARDAMQQYLNNRPRDKHGTHSYTLEDYGLSHKTHEHLFEEYTLRFCS